MSKAFRRFLLLTLACIVLPGIAFLIVMWRFPADPARYHFSALREADRNFMSSETDQTATLHWEAVLEHRQALVNLGALQKVVLPLRQINVSSDEFNELTDILRRNTAEGPFAQFEWEEGNNLTPIGVRIWYKPGELSRWESELSSYRSQP